MTTTKGNQEAVPDQQFRDIIGRFASGVTVITTTAEDGDHGTTASAVSSLSMDPPMLLICLNRTSETRAAILQAGVFGVNILAEHQGEIAYKFAKKGQDKFQGVGILRGENGIPLVEDALAHIECDVVETVTGGTHTVFLGRVKTASGTDSPPLTYFRGRFGRLESTLDEAAYRDIRQRVIERTLAAGQRIDIGQLAVELNVDTPHVFYALTKLSTDGLVARRDDGYAVTSLTADRAAQLFDARCIIQLGVVEQTIGSIGEEALDNLERLAEDFARIGKNDPPDLIAFVRASNAFHQHLIALAECEQLSDTYGRLGIPAFWTRTLPGRHWWEEWDLSHHTDLVRALRSRDVARAKILVRGHRDWIKNLVRTLIVEAGGRV